MPANQNAIIDSAWNNYLTFAFHVSSFVWPQVVENSKAIDTFMRIRRYVEWCTCTGARCTCTGARCTCTRIRNADVLDKCSGTCRARRGSSASLRVFLNVVRRYQQQFFLETATTHEISIYLLVNVLYQQFSCQLHENKYTCAELYWQCLYKIWSNFLQNHPSYCT